MLEHYYDNYAGHDLTSLNIVYEAACTYTRTIFLVGDEYLDNKSLYKTRVQPPKQYQKILNTCLPDLCYTINIAHPESACINCAKHGETLSSKVLMRWGHTITSVLNGHDCFVRDRIKSTDTLVISLRDRISYLLNLCPMYGLQYNPLYCSTRDRLRNTMTLYIKRLTEKQRPNRIIIVLPETSSPIELALYTEAYQINGTTLTGLHGLESEL